MARGEGIKRINNLFDKYKKTLKAPQGSVTKEVRGLIYEMFDIELSSHQCSYVPRSRTIILTVGGPIKSEILLQKNRILEELKKRLGEKSAPTQIL